MIAEEDRRRVFGKGALLVDGHVRGAWRIARENRSATLAIEPFIALAEVDARAVTEEGERLLGFVAKEARIRSVQMLPLAV